LCLGDYHTLESGSLPATAIERETLSENTTIDFKVFDIRKRGLHLSSRASESLGELLVGRRPTAKNRQHVLRAVRIIFIGITNCSYLP
jgi:hypothetical protein